MNAPTEPKPHRCIICGGAFLESEPHNTEGRTVRIRERIRGGQFRARKIVVPAGPCRAPEICKRLGVTAEQLRDTFGKGGDA